jgi:hypothetical protein
MRGHKCERKGLNDNSIMPLEVEPKRKDYQRLFAPNESFKNAKEYHIYYYYFFFFICPHKEIRKKIRISDLRFMRHDLQPIKLPLRDR